MFADLQNAIVNYLKGKQLIEQHGIHVWTNSTGDLEILIQSQLNAIHPLAIIVHDIAPDKVGDVYNFLDMGVGVSLSVVENIALNGTPIHAINLTMPLLQWLHSWGPQDIDGFTGVLMAVPEQPVVDTEAPSGLVSKLFRFTTTAGAEVDHSTQYNS